MRELPPRRRRTAAATGSSTCGCKRRPARQSAGCSPQTQRPSAHGSNGAAVTACRYCRDHLQITSTDDRGALKGLKRCGDEGRHSLAADPPHADFVDLVEGLYGAGIAPERARMFTMLRDPVERAVSEYLHVRFVLGRERRCATTGSLGEIWAWDYRASCNFTLAQFATDPAYAPAMNRQTRMLAGTAGREPDELYANGQEMLATARDNLRRMSWFGITDSVNLSMSVLPTSMHSRVSAARRGRSRSSRRRRDTARRWSRSRGIRRRSRRSARVTTSMRSSSNMPAACCKTWWLVASALQIRSHAQPRSFASGYARHG